MKSLLLFVITLLLASPAVALTPSTTTLVSDTTLSVPSTFEVDGTTAYVGIAECERMIANSSLIGVTFGTVADTTLEAGLFERVALFSVDRDSSARIDCDSGDLCREIDAEDVDQTSTTIDVELEFGELTEFTSEADCADIDAEFFVRAELREFADDEEFELADARVIVDAIRPTAPTLNNVTVTESIIRVEFTPSPDTDLLRYRVVYSTEAFSEGALPDEINADGKTFGNADVESGEVSVDLEPGATVYVGLAAQDETGNLSPVSAVTEATAVETTDFWEAYKQAGGSESGGCSHTPADAPTDTFFWIAAAALALTLRRRSQ